MELKLVASAIIGGCSLNGRECSIFELILGLIILLLISNVITMLNYLFIGNELLLVQYWF